MDQSNAIAAIQDLGNKDGRLQHQCENVVKILQKDKDKATFLL